MKAIIFLLLAALLLGMAAYLRTPEYDEAYSLFLTAGHARPAWPSGVFTAGSVRWLFSGQAGFAAIAQNLKAGDVHPPLYFWALEMWRRAAGPSWFAARVLSVAFSVAALALVGRIAAMTGRPVMPSMALTLFSYGFAYTGILARNFALAQCLALLGVALLLSAQRRAAPDRSLLGGLALGAASFTNYLSSFNGAAMLLWLALHRDRRRMLPPAAAGFGLFVGLLDLPFFLAQRALPPWAICRLSPGLTRFGSCSGIPAPPCSAGCRFMPGRPAPLSPWSCSCSSRPASAAAWDQGPSPFPLLAAAAPAGLLLLGLVFGNTPIEIRYLAFSLPFLALFLAPCCGADSWCRCWRRRVWR